MVNALVVWTSPVQFVKFGQSGGSDGSSGSFDGGSGCFSSSFFDGGACFCHGWIIFLVATSDCEMIFSDPSKSCSKCIINHNHQ